MFDQLAQFGNYTQDPSSHVYDNQVALPTAPPIRLTANFADMSTTVYVGHICSRISDESVRELLDICGNISKWIRQPDPISGKLGHFGFCEFKRLEGAWRAIQLLNGRQVGSKTLVVKADAKVQERVDDFTNSQRVSFENEQRLRSTLNALVTTINSKWREEAMANDAELQPVTTSDIAAPLPLMLSTKAEDALPKWYRDSRREEDRLRRIERRRRERQADFEKAVKNWESYEEKKIAREFERDEDDVDISVDRKMKLIAQDGEGGKVTSDYTWVERKREIEADNRDRLNEEKEIAAKPERDIEELAELEKRLRCFPFSDEVPNISADEVSQTDIIPENIPQRVKNAIRSLPKTKESISKTQFDFHTTLTEQTILKLRSWLKRKLRRLGANEDESILVSALVIKCIEVKQRLLSFSTLRQSLELFPRLSSDQCDEIAKKCMQLLIFTESIL